MIDGSEKLICRLTFNCIVRVFLERRCNTQLPLDTQLKRRFQAPAKRWRHANTTYGRISQLGTLLSATCCKRLATLLRLVGCCWLQFDHFVTCANNTQHAATPLQHGCQTHAFWAQRCCVGMFRSFGRGVRVSVTKYQRKATVDKSISPIP